MTKRETLILKYLSNVSNRLRLVSDHLKTELVSQEGPTESTDLTNLNSSSDVPESLQVYRFYLTEIALQSKQIEELINLLEKKNTNS